MLFFLDTASVDEIKKALKTGLIDGVTTNPSLIVRCGRNIYDVIKEISDLVNGPISVEVTEESVDEMLKQAEEFCAISKNIVIKIPLTQEGIEACVELRKRGINVNMTLCFSSTQALLAAKAGATYISLFIGRLEDHGKDGLALVSHVRAIYDNFPMLNTQILAASVRNPKHVGIVAELGAEAITMPPKVFYSLFEHYLTTQGVETFNAEWKKYIENCPSLQHMDPHTIE